MGDANQGDDTSQVGGEPISPATVLVHAAGDTGSQEGARLALSAGVRYDADCQWFKPDENLRLPLQWTAQGGLTSGKPWRAYHSDGS
jgi:hypothetical protein